MTTASDGDTNSNPTAATAVFIQQPFPESLLDLDDYHGVTIRFDRSISDEQQSRWSSNSNNNNHSGRESSFRQDLQDALSLWRLERKRGIWIHVPESMAFVVPHCVALGFSFHSVQQNPNLLVLTQWLPTDTPSRLPRGATHQIGVGMVVLSPQPTGSTSDAAIDNNSNNTTDSTSATNSDPRILLVQERTGPAARRKLWKMPTGLIDPGEDISEAAIRELKEETGLDGVFEGIICLRHAPQGGAGRSVPDLFFVVRVRLLTLDQEVQLQTDEIADMCWMPLTEYYSQDIWKTSPAYQQLNRAIFDSVMTSRDDTDNNNNKKNSSNSSDNSLLLRPHRLLTGYMPGYNIVYDNTKL